MFCSTWRCHGRGVVTSSFLGSPSRLELSCRARARRFSWESGKCWVFLAMWRSSWPFLASRCSTHSVPYFLFNGPLAVDQLSRESPGDSCMTTVMPIGPERRGLLFDLDGVLWDSSRIHEQAFNEICERYGLRPVKYEELAGRPTSSAWRLVLEINEQPPDDGLIRRMTTEKQELARNLLRGRPPLSPEIHVLSSLPGNLSLGLVTGASAETTAIFLEAARVDFDVVVTSESVHSGKPSPEPYETAASHIGLSEADCWVLEDSAQGIESALQAGTHCVHLTPQGAHCTMDHAKLDGCVATIRDFMLVSGGVRE